MEIKDFYKIAIETRNLEIGLFWQRSNYFLVLNTAIAVGFFSEQGSPYQLWLSLLGAFVSILWFLINLGSKYWQSRWENRVYILENKLDKEINMFAASKDLINEDVRESLTRYRPSKQPSLYDRWVLRKPSVSKIMSWLSASFIIFWLSISISTINTTINPTKALNSVTAKSAAPVS